MQKITKFALSLVMAFVALAVNAQSGWDGTVTTSLDGKTISSIADLEGMTITFNGASTVAGDGMGALTLMSKKSASEELTHAVWFPAPYAEMGTPCTAEVDGNKITLSNWVSTTGMFAEIDPLPTEAATLYLEDLGAFTVDGEEVELPHVEFSFVPGGEQGAQPFMLTSVSNNGVEGNAVGVEASENGVFYTFIATATGKVLTKGEGVPTLSLMEDATVDFGEANILTTEGESANIRFMGPQQYYFTQPGTYVLSIPEGTFVDAEGTPNAAVTAKWVVIQGEEKTPFDITAVTMNWKGEEIAAGSEVEALSYAYNVVTDKEGLVAGEGHIEFKNAEGAGIGVGSWNGYYLSFANFGQDGYTTPGTYTLTIPAGALVDAEGNPCNEFTATWTVVAPETQEINIETVEVGTVTDTSYGSNDVYYTATVKFQKPEGAKYVYSEGLHMDFNGENTGVPFKIETGNQSGIYELPEGDEVTLVFKDQMIATTDWEEYEGDLRPAGSYVGQTEIYFMDEEYLELPVVAKYTGSIVLPNLNAVELGTPEFNVAVAAEAGEKITEGWVEANGIVMTLVDAKNITPDMTIKVVADLMATVPGYGAPDGEDGGFNMPQFEVVLPDTEFTGDAMFGAATVAMPEFAQYVVEAGAGNAFQIIVKSIEVIGATGVEASWVMDEESLVGCAFEVVEAEPAAPSFGGVAFNVEEGAKITVDDVHNLAIKMYFPDGTGFEGYAFAGDVMLVKQNAEGEWDYANPVGFAELYSEFAEDMLDAEFAPALFAEALQNAVVGETYRVLAIDYALLDADFEPVTFESYENPTTAPYVTFEVVDAATGINTVKFNVTDVKYNLAGQRVNNAKGIVIMNGKKVVLK